MKIARLTIALVVILISELTILALAFIDTLYPVYYYRVTKSTLFPILPQLVGTGLVALFVGLYLQQAGRQKDKREREEEKQRERAALLASIRAELEQNMNHLIELTPAKVNLQRHAHLVGSEKVQTDTWDSCISSGKTILLRPEEMGDMGTVYRLLRDYNEKVSDILPPLDYGERTQLAHEIDELLSKSYWTKP
jgi:hypothetical protein